MNHNIHNNNIDPDSVGDGQRKKTLILAIALLLALVVLGGFTWYALGGANTPDKTKPTPTPTAVSIQTPSSAPVTAQNTPTVQATANTPNSAADSDTGAPTEASAKATAKLVMDAVNQGGAGKDIAQRLNGALTSAEAASLQPVPYGVLIPKGDTLSDITGDDRDTTITIMHGSNPLYSVSMRPYTVAGKTVWQVYAIDVLDDGTEAVTGADGKPVPIDVVPLSKEGQAAFYRDARNVLATYVEYDAPATPEARMAKAKAAVNGGEVPPLRAATNDLGAETHVRIFQPINLAILNGNAGEAATPGMISVREHIMVANVRASRDVIDQFDAVVDYKWDAAQGIWVPAGIRLI